MTDLKTEYEQAWRSFTTDFSRLCLSLAEPHHQAAMHDALTELFWVPYEEARRLFQTPAVDSSNENIGSITGLFFENLVMALIVPAFRRAVPDAFIQRNGHNKQFELPARDPDLYVMRGDRAVVVEAKVTPKKGEIEYVERMRDEHAAIGVGYFLVGGDLAASEDTFDRFRARNWGCFMSAAKTKRRLLDGIPTLDNVVEEAIRALGGA